MSPEKAKWGNYDSDKWEKGSWVIEMRDFFRQKEDDLTQEPESWATESKDGGALHGENGKTMTQWTGRRASGA